ncbi:PstS family phosphate ABC transporter substrate-binding protein [Sphaerothrix gracilis]|uniref:PstS family phosphate ABC transporter substrate-binding protein n=1 Tax=Sphaerothrix gracilis TaxID=3151835 RepID=UPI0031FC6D02
MNSLGLRHLLLGSTLIVLTGCAAFRSTDTTIATNRIKIGGSSEAYEAIEMLTDAYSERDTSSEFEYFPPSQTSGGIEGVKVAVLDVGAVSRAVTTAETGDELIYLPLVKTPLVIVVHSSVAGVTNISAEQIKGIYSGDITNWQALDGPDAEIIVFDFTEDENEKQVLRSAYLGPDLEITPDAVVFAEDDELLETAANTEFSIAAVPLENELAELPMTVLSIDGVEPTAENLQSDTYPMALSLGMILPKVPTAATKAFIEFVKSEAGQTALTDANYVLAQ